MANRTNDIIYNNYDQYTGEMFTTTIVTEWYDGTPMSDLKVDNAVYFKNKPELGGGYSKRNFSGSAYASWFGVSPDREDNYVALQLAIDTCSELAVANGVIKISNSIVIRNKIKFYGENGGTSIIEKTNYITSGLPPVIPPSDAGEGVSWNMDVDGVLIILNPDSSYLNNVLVKNLTFRHSASLYSNMSVEHRPKCFGVYTPFLSSSQFEDVITSWNGTGYLGQSNFLMTFKKCRFEENQIGGFAILTGSSLTIDSCYAKNCKVWGWDVGAGYSTLISCGADGIGRQNTASATTLPAEFIYKIRSTISLIDCGSENSKGTMFHITGTGGKAATVNGFHMYNYFGVYAAEKLPVVKLNAGAILNMTSTWLNPIRTSASPLNMNMVDLGDNAKLVINNAQITPAITTSNIILAPGSSLIWIDNGTIHQFAGESSTLFKYSLSSQWGINLTNLKWDSGNYFTLRDGEGHNKHIWVSGSEGLIRVADMKPSSDTDGFVLGHTPYSRIFNSPDTFRLGTYRFWITATGVVMYKDGVPSTEIDGTVLSNNYNSTWSGKTLLTLGGYKFWVVSGTGEVRYKLGVPTTELDGVSLTTFDSTALVKGKIKLAGDLAGTADLPTVPGLALKLSTAGGTMTGKLTLSSSIPSLDNDAVRLTDLVKRRKNVLLTNVSSFSSPQSDLIFRFTGSVCVIQLTSPATGSGFEYYIINRGTGNITINSTGGLNDIDTNGILSATATIVPGGTIKLVSDGFKWVSV
ncbi:hypothetical protein [Pedobacter antarcticus]|uniref:hypothetical protein n=1 Tax=Pedobacter antarcticus TaxID=34086 RepID=UPI00293186F7|nr:hypothetical protein [Pedobacter antarcticus]